MRSAATLSYIFLGLIKLLKTRTTDYHPITTAKGQLKRKIKPRRSIQSTIKM